MATRRLIASILFLLMASCRNTGDNAPNADAAYKVVQDHLKSYLNADSTDYKFQPLSHPAQLHDTLMITASFSGSVAGQPATAHPFTAHLLPDSAAGSGWRLLQLTLDGDRIEGSSEEGVPLQTAYQNQVLSTPYYAVQVNSQSAVKEVKTGEPAVDVKSNDNSYFYVINVTFKNTSQESRLLFDGDLHVVTGDGQKEEYGQPQSIDAAGYGASLEQLAPLATFTTNIVFKMPSGLKGRAYWVPGRVSNAYRIYLGVIGKP